MEGVPQRLLEVYVNEVNSWSPPGSPSPPFGDRLAEKRAGISEKPYNLTRNSFYHRSEKSNWGLPPAKIDGLNHNRNREISEAHFYFPLILHQTQYLRSKRVP